MSYKAGTLVQNHVYSDTSTNATSSANSFGNAPQTSAQGRIWQAGQGLTVDASGNVYFSSGNGAFEVSSGGIQQTGNSFVKLSPTLSLLDFFTPFNSASLNMGDQDLGSAGLLNIPGTSLMLSGGKPDIFYLVDSTDMGHFNASQDQVKQEFRAIFGTGSQHIHGGPVYFNGATHGPTIYVWGENDVLRAFSFSTSSKLLNTTPIAMSTMTAPMTNANGAMPGGFLSLSANGTSNGIVWASTPFSATLFTSPFRASCMPSTPATSPNFGPTRLTTQEMRPATSPSTILQPSQTAKFSLPTSARSTLPMALAVSTPMVFLPSFQTGFTP